METLELQEVRFEIGKLLSPYLCVHTKRILGMYINGVCIVSLLATAEGSDKKWLLNKEAIFYEKKDFGKFHYRYEIDGDTLLATLKAVKKLVMDYPLRYEINRDDNSGFRFKNLLKEDFELHII